MTRRRGKDTRLPLWGGDEPRDRRDGQGGPVQDSTGKLVVANAQRKEADYLKVVTTRMRPGYLQKNGVPYSGNALLEEYFDTFTDPYTHSTWLAVTDGGHRSAIPHRTADHPRALQENSGQFRVGSHAMPRRRTTMR